MNDPTARRTFDRGEIRRRILLRLFGHPLGIVPAVAGVGLALTPIFFSVDPALPLFAGVVGVVLGGASIAVRALLGRDAIGRQVIEELEREAAAAQDARIRELRGELSSDDDPRDERLFDDLLRLVAAIRDDRGWREHVEPVVAADILADLDELARRSVTALQRGLTLERTARELHSARARAGLEAERERLLADVQATVESVGELLTQLKVHTAQRGVGSTNLDQLRTSLSRTLDAARAAEDEAANPKSPSPSSTAREAARRASTLESP
jgi:hypothetical protein